MSERDRAIMGEIGLPVARVAHALQVTRQSLHEGIANSKKDWLNAPRMKTLLVHLEGSSSGEEREAANRLRRVMEQLSSKFSLDEKVSADQIRSVADRYLIFSTWPLELSEAGYIDMMEDRVFGTAELVSYFVPPDRAARPLSEVLQSHMTGRTRSTQRGTSIFIVESNVVTMMPHLAVVRSKDGWKGVAVGLAGDLGSRDPISDQLVTDIMNTLRKAGLDAHGAPGGFFPKGKKQLAYDGIYFRNYSF